MRDRPLSTTHEVICAATFVVALACYRHLELLVFGLNGVLPGADWWWDASLNATNMLAWGQNLFAWQPLTEGLTYWPTPGSLALTEQIPLYAVLMPALTSLMNDVHGAHNLLVLLSTALSSGAFYALLRRLGLPVLPALLGAALVGLHPFGTRQAPRLQLLCTFPFAIALIGLFDLRDGLRRGRLLVALGVFLAAATCVYYIALLLGLVVVVSAMLFIPLGARRRMEATAWAAGATALAVVPAFSWFVHHLTHNRRLGVSRTSKEIAEHYLPLEALFESPGLALWGPAVRRLKPDLAAFPGGVALALIGLALLALTVRWLLEHHDGDRVRLSHRLLLSAGVVTGLSLVGWSFGSAVPGIVAFLTWVATAPGFGDRRLRPLLLAGLCCLAISLGPRLVVLGLELQAPFGFLHEHLRPVGAIRAAPRYAHLGMNFLALWALALVALPFSRSWATGGAAVLLVLVFIDLKPAPDTPIVLEPADTLDGVRWLRDHAEEGAVLHLGVRADGRVEPWPGRGTVLGHEISVLHRFRAFEHGHPIVNGHSGLDPPLHGELLYERLKGFPHDRGLTLLRRLGVRYLHAHRRIWDRSRYQAFEEFVAERPTLAVRLHDRDELVVEITDRSPPPLADPPPLPAAYRLPRSCTIMVNGVRPAQLLDGDPRSLFVAGSGLLAVDMFCQGPMALRGFLVQADPLTRLPGQASLRCPDGRGGRTTIATDAALDDLRQLAYAPAQRTVFFETGAIASDTYRLELGTLGGPPVAVGELLAVPLGPDDLPAVGVCASRSSGL